MAPIQTVNALTQKSPTRLSVALSVTISGFLALSLIAPRTFGRGAEFEEHCRGLHAGIRSQHIDTSSNKDPYVMITFILLNDAQTPINTSANTWTLVINGKELTDSGWIFGNGPGPIGGWGTLDPGDTYEFGKALPINHYFPEAREYRVCWKGKGFQSPTITVKITALNK